MGFVTYLILVLHAVLIVVLTNGLILQIVSILKAGTQPGKRNRD